MKKKLMGLAFVGAFLAASLGVFGFVKAETTSEDITPNLNVVRSIEDKDQVNMYKAVIDEKGYQNITLNFDASKKYAAIVISGPFGAVKEQASGLYAQTRC